MYTLTLEKKNTARTKPTENKKKRQEREKCREEETGGTGEKNGEGRSNLYHATAWQQLNCKFCSLVSSKKAQVNLIIC